MKNLFALIGVVATILSIFSATITTTTKDKNNLAEVNRMQGMYLFTDCEPVNDYEHLGTVKGPAVSIGSSQYQGVRDRLIKRVLKQFPKAEGVIFHFYDGGIDKADAIIFKD